MTEEGANRIAAVAVVHVHRFRGEVPELVFAAAQRFGAPDIELCEQPAAGVDEQGRAIFDRLVLVRADRIGICG